MDKIHDAIYMIMARNLLSLSPNTGRKTSCLIVDARGPVIGECNRFPDGVQPTAARLERPQSYIYVEHAERLAIYTAAREGLRLDGCTAYLPWFPCSDCARALVQAGIKRMVAVEPDWNEERYNFKDSLAILTEGGVQVDYEPHT